MYNLREVRLWGYSRANASTTQEVLRRIRKELPTEKVVVVWDRASYHRAASVVAEAKRLNLQLEPLPAYSPDFMPVEELWRWFRADVSRNRVFDTRTELRQAATVFQNRINLDPYAVADRLYVRDELDPDIEKLRVSA